MDLKSQYQSIKTEINKAIFDVINDSSFVGGHYVEKFEQAFAGFCKAQYCVGVGNGTDALWLALKALNIGRGDEVITAANTFIATSEAITLSGANIVFVDINPKTYNIDFDKIEEKISAKTKAIIPVHLYGQPADMDPILKLAERYDLKIIEDAAQAHGAEYKGRMVGSIGHVGCFSFYPGKNLGAYGDGGAIITNDDELAKKARMIANHGRIDKYDHEIEGVNSRLDGIQAAILNVKLKYLPEWTEKRRKNAYLYNEYLDNSKITIPYEPDIVKAVYHIYAVRVPPEKRQKLIDHLSAYGVSTGLHYPIALPNLKAYAYLNYRPKDFPAAFAASQGVLSLPIFAELEEKSIKYIANLINEHIN